MKSKISNARTPRAYYGNLSTFVIQHLCKTARIKGNIHREIDHIMKTYIIPELKNKNREYNNLPNIHFEFKSAICLIGTKKAAEEQQELFGDTDYKVYDEFFNELKQSIIDGRKTGKYSDRDIIVVTPAISYHTDPSKNFKYVAGHNQVHYDSLVVIAFTNENEVYCVATQFACNSGYTGDDNKSMY